MTGHRIKRRRVLAGLLALGAARVPLDSRAQTTKQFRIGLLYFGDEASARAGEEALFAGLRDLGYVAGRNLLLEVRFARGDTARLPVLAGELIALKPDVLLAIEPEASLLRSKTRPFRSSSPPRPIPWPPASCKALPGRAPM